MNPPTLSPEKTASGKRRLLLAAAIAALAAPASTLAASSKGKKRTARPPRASGNAQARDIDALVHELDYLIEVARNLQRKHGGDTSRTRFSYPKNFRF